MMSARAAISLAKQKSSAKILQLRCRVRPGASKTREGVVAITDETIELCVSAQPQDGKANGAVLEVLSKVSERPSPSPCPSHVPERGMRGSLANSFALPSFLRLFSVGSRHSKI